MKRAFLFALALICFCSPALALTDVQEITNGGAKAWLIEDHSLPLVTVKITFEKSGVAYDPKGKEGLAYFASMMMDEGAGDMDSLAFHSALESKAIRFSAESGVDTFTLSMQTLADNKARAFELFNLALHKPRFDQEAVERIRSGLLSELKQLEEDPNYIASLNWKERAFPNHAYGRPRHGTKETISGITPEDLHGLVGRMACAPYLVGVVGDVTPEEVKGWLAALSERSCLAGQVEAAIPDVSVTEGASEPVVVKLPLPQTVVVASLPGYKRDDPHYYALEVLNYVLGGSSLTSRLGTEIRDKRGLAYYAESDLQTMDHAAYISMTFSTRDAQTYAALKIFRDTLKSIADRGITAQELSDAKNYITGSFPMQIDNQPALAEYLLGMQHFHLGRDYLGKRNGFITKVTLEEVNQVARGLLSHTPLIVTAGAPEQKPEPNKNK